MRGFAAVLVMALFSYSGYSKVWKMQLRMRLLSGFAKDINCLCGELRMRPREINIISKAFIQGERGEFWKLFSAGTESAQRAEDAWNSALAGYPLSKLLDSEEYALIKEAGLGIGAKGLQLQIEYMQASAKAIASAADAVQSEISKKGGLYSRLGFLAGAAAALIII